MHIAGGSGVSRTLTSRRTARFERGGLTKCPALPNKLAVMRGFEPLGPGINRATGFPDQLFKPLTHITAKTNLAESIRFERMTPKWCSALAVRRLRPLGQLSGFSYSGAGRGH